MTHQYDTTIESAVRCDAIDNEALAHIYGQCIEEKRYVQAEHLLQSLGERFPQNRQLQHLNIDLNIQQKKYRAAMHQTERLISRCSPDDKLIDAAMAVRKINGTPKQSLSNCDTATISLCMVVKNEQEGLGACLHAAKKLVDEVVVIDTGSVDRTRDIANIYGAHLFEFNWRNDFAAARNFSLQYAKGDWILILDADEIIAARDHETIRAIVDDNGNEAAAYNVVTRNYTNLTNAIGWEANEGIYHKYEAGAGWFPTGKVRLFPRNKGINFRYPVHERVDPVIRSMNMKIIDCTVPVHHYGYLNELKRREKAARYLELGVEKIDQFRDDLEAIRELAVQAGQLEQWHMAVELWLRFIEIRPDFAEAHVNLAGVYWQLALYDKALRSSIKAITLDHSMKEAYYNEAVSLMHLGRAEESKEILAKLLVKHKGYLGARFMLAAALSFTGNYEQSALEFKVCQSTLSKQAVSLAVEKLVARLQANNQEAYGRLLEKTMASVNGNGN